MERTLPTQARIVIVGGGIIGCSVAYHLTKLGIRDVLLLERGKLTCGTSWHAAGLVMQLRANHTLTRLSRYGAQLYEALEAETGQATGLRRSGSLPIARTPERLIEIRRMASLGKLYGVETETLTPREVKALYPILDEKQVVGGVHIPSDGQTNPVDTTIALAKGARLGGAKIFEDVAVEDVLIDQGAVAGVETSAGRVACEVLVCCAGIWSRDFAARAGVLVPLYACEHMYVVTDPLPEVTRDLPVLRDADGTVYVKEEAGKLLVGSFEPRGKPLPLSRLPSEGRFVELQEDWDHFAEPMTKAIAMIPLLAEAPIRRFMNGPESFTPDNKFILGEAPELRNFFVASGFNSQGILSAAGAGRAIAEWIEAGGPTMDLAEIDIARFQRFQVNRRYLEDRVAESLGLLYAMHWPHRQFETARPVRKTPLWHRLKASNACFGEAAGWERANWYAPPGIQPRYSYSYGRQNWFAFVGDEHRAAREAVALFDLSSFAKFYLEGPDAEAVLQKLCANDMAVEPGRIVYTQLLNPRGGIEADLTVTRLTQERFLLVTAAASQRRDMTWLRRQIAARERVVLTDVTSGLAVLAVMGPQSRALLQRLTDADLSTTAFPFRSCREIEIGYALAQAMRISYVGELGWELYLPTEFAEPLFDLLLAEGSAQGLRLAGYHALDSLRCEKGYRHWGHDITPNDTPLEAGLGFAVSFRKAADFIGREALERQRQAGVRRRQVHLRLDAPEPILLHDEPIWRRGKLVGQVTSGAFGHTLGRSVGLGYVTLPSGEAAEWAAGEDYEIEIAGERYSASAALKPFYDPQNERLYR